MTVAQLSAFLAVLDQGSFSEAAKALGLTQSGVSRAVKTLEEAIGVPLLLRDGGGVEATVTGREVASEARGALERIARIRRLGDRAVDRLDGRVRIGSFFSSSTRLLPGTLAAFRRAYPRAETVVFEGDAPEIADWLARGTIDVGFLEDDDERFEHTPIARDEMVYVAPAGHPGEAKRPFRLRAFKDPFIMSLCGCEQRIQDIFRAERAAPDVRFEVRDITTILAMVREGIGTTMLPTLALPDDRGGLAIIPLRPRANHAYPYVRDVRLAVARTSTCASARAFVEVARRWADERGKRASSQLHAAG
jgi:DNA-binding transcriptional LysR family regulator